MPDTLTPSTEDYLETIYLIGQELPVIRVKDISSRMGVSMPSVNSAVKNLASKKFVNFEKYGYIQLTEAGLKRGRSIFEKHTLLKTFFRDILGVPPETAEIDACKIEHHISNTTMNKLKDFSDFILSNRTCIQGWNDEQD